MCLSSTLSRDPLQACFNNSATFRSTPAAPTKHHLHLDLLGTPAGFAIGSRQPTAPNG